MRKHFISLRDAPTFDDAELLAPDWATVITECDDGWMCFESEPDADIWEGRT
jgi:hypothetical protein